MKNQEWSIPVFIAKGVATSGFVSDLAPLQMGIYDATTQAVATGAGNGKKFFLGCGAPNTRDNLTKFYNGMQDPKVSSSFYGKDLIAFEKSFPSRPSNEEWVIGYDGQTSAKGLTYNLGQTYQMKIRLFGDPVFAKFNRSVEKIITLNTGCAVQLPCGTPDCTNQAVDYIAQTQAWCNIINTNVELQEFKLHAQPVFDNYVSTVPNAHVYNINVVDNGDADALFALQRAFPTIKNMISRKQYVAGTSTYQLTAPPPAILTVAETKATATITVTTLGTTGNTLSVVVGGVTIGTYTQAVGDTTTTLAATGIAAAINAATATNGGFTATSSTNVVTITTGFANAGAAYNGTVITATPTGTLAVTSTNFAGGVTALPTAFTPSASVLLAVCGTCPSGYTTVVGYDSYIIRRQLSSTDVINTTAAQATYAAAIVTAYSATTGSGVFLGVWDGVASVKINVASGVVPSPLVSDIVEKIASTPTVCTPTSPSPISWVSVQDGYTVTRLMRVKIGTLDCSEVAPADLPSDVNTALTSPSIPSYVANSAIQITADSTGCVKVFQISQTSQFMVDKCLSPELASYDVLPTYKGQIFVPYITPASPNTTVKAGIRISAPYMSTKFGNCSFVPDEFYDNEPLRMEIAIFDQSGNVCNFGNLAQPRRVKTPQYRRLSGELVARKYIECGVYFSYEVWSNDPRIREAIDNNVLSFIDKNKYYVAYYLRFREAREDQNFHQKGQVWEPVIYVEEGDTATQAAIENAIQAITTKWDITLTKRGA